MNNTSLRSTSPSPCWDAGNTVYFLGFWLSFCQHLMFNWNWKCTISPDVLNPSPHQETWRKKAGQEDVSTNSLLLRLLSSGSSITCIRFHSFVWLTAIFMVTLFQQIKNLLKNMIPMSKNSAPRWQLHITKHDENTHSEEVENRARVPNFDYLFEAILDYLLKQSLTNSVT